MLFVEHNQEDTREANISKYKSERKNEITLLMIRIERFNKTKIPNYNDNSIKGYFLEVDIENPKDKEG